MQLVLSPPPTTTRASCDVAAISARLDRGTADFTLIEMGFKWSIASDIGSRLGCDTFI